MGSLLFRQRLGMGILVKLRVANSWNGRPKVYC